MKRHHRIITKTIGLLCFFVILIFLISTGYHHFFKKQKNDYPAEQNSKQQNNVAGKRIINEDRLIDSTIKSTGHDNDLKQTNDQADQADVELIEAELSDSILIQQDVPFTSQAPYADWDDPRQQDGCEEASALMAIYWAQDKSLTRYEADKLIKEISDWEDEKYSSFHDTSAQDTVLRIIQGYFNHQNAEVKNKITVEEIITIIKSGKLVLAPANGQILGNPHFTQPGPETHMLVIIGYDQSTDEFITNDPGTKHGEKYRYKTATLFNALRDYPTGNHEPINAIEKNIIIFGK